MNYVILNGVKSNTIKGLMIQSLPPISKPLLRTEVEEIEGRDGDIITKLGYSAYDKTISVGLFGDYNIDDVIKYFDSEGTVTFSNEPDKFYNYQIIRGIDFERLIRFRVAEVVFHVQPFKYSAVENAHSFINDFLGISYYSATKNGITLTADNDVITINGTGITATEFYVPLKSQNVATGAYTLSVSTNGTGANACSVRLIKSAPSNADSFGGDYLGLKNNTTVTLTGQISANTVYGYLWFYINAGTEMDFTMNAELTSNNFNSVTVFNKGNTIAKPVITLQGSGTINLYVNGTQLFVINLGQWGRITIDAIQMNAYQGDILLNRSVTGDYDNLVLNIGTNVISWSGNVSSFEIENFSRWI